MFSIGIVAHTSRTTQAKRLTATVKADFISIDNGLLGCDGNHVAVQRHLSALSSDWSIVLEDDALPVDGFRRQVGKVLGVAPAPVVSLYLGRLRPPHWQKRVGAALASAASTGACWVVGDRLLHAVGYCVRTDLLPDLADFESEFPSDQRVSAWVRARGLSVGYSVPSLLDHADGVSVAAHPDGQPRPAGRCAWQVGVRDVWTSTSVALR